MQELTKGAYRYYEELNGSKVILVDFDNTVCLDEWPKVGPILPGAIEVLKALQYSSHKIVLYTQRSKKYPICHPDVEALANELGIPEHVRYIDILSDAIKVFKDNDIWLWDVNANGRWEQRTNDNSRKIFNDFIIDDHCIGMPKNDMVNSKDEVCNVVDWYYIDDCCVSLGLYDRPVLDHNINNK